MQIRLAGDGDKIPLEALPDFEQTNALTLVLPDGYIFNKADFIALGYENYEVICIGGAGGRGGKSSFSAAGFTYHTFFTQGGSGGGGGLHVVAGALADLPDSCAVVVGAAGVDGLDGVYSSGAYGGSDGHGTLDRGDPGTDGAASTFGATICRASGGKGGGAPPANNNKAARSGNDALREVWDGTQWIGDVRAGGDGGQGGKGGQTTAGGGGNGGKSLPGGYSSASGSHANTPQTLSDPENGGWDGTIGEGGGGGRGGTFGLWVNNTMFAV